MKREQFFDEIDKIILESVKKHPDFYYLMKHSKGIHPIDIKLSLGRLCKTKKITHILYKKIMKSARDKGKVVLENSNFLPVPHLLDYDWRFNMKGNEVLCSLINDSCKKENRKIAFIGTPSLFKKFFLKSESKNQYILIDKNADKHIQNIAQYANNFSYIQHDIMNEGFIELSVDLVIMDPPWYLNYNKLFFHFADSILSKDGTIICVLPPKYTRQNIDEEFVELKKFINELGISVKRYLTNVVNYNTPPFERNALRANGIFCMPKEWRTGDILIAEKKQGSKSKIDIVKIEEKRWCEIDIGIVRYKLKYDGDLQIKSFDIDIESVYPHDIYPSVKRSMSKSEKSINLWTSGNRVFYCNNIPLLYYILLKYSMQYKHYDMEISDNIEKRFNVHLNKIQKSNLIRCMKLIEVVTKKEEKEYGNWGRIL